MQNNFETEPQIIRPNAFPSNNQVRSSTSIGLIGKALKIPLDFKNLETRSSLHLHLASGAINSFPTRERALSQKEIVDKITDFKDKFQIWEAVNHPNTTREKIKVIDAVIQRREEIEEKKRRKRSLKAHTLLPTLIPKFKKNLQPTNITNRFRKSTIDLKFDNPLSPEVIQENFPSPEIRSSHTRIGTFVKIEKDESESSDSSEESVKLVFPMEESPKLKLRLMASLPTSQFKTAGNSPMHSSRLGGSYAFFHGDEVKKYGEQQGSPRVGSYSPGRKVGFFPSSEVQSRDVSPIVRDQSRKTSTFKNFENFAPLKTLNERCQQAPLSLTLQRSQGTKSIENFSQSRNLKNGPTDDIYNIAGKKFEKDLYRFLLVNKNKNESHAIVNSSPIKRKKMRKIEEKVFSQFEQSTLKNENLGYYLGNLLQTKLAKLEKEKDKALLGTSNKVSPQLRANVEIDKRKSKVGKKSSSLVRKIDPQIIENIKTKVGQKKIVPKLEQKVQNEVHEFLTETHLDNPHIRNRKLSLGMVQYIQKPSRQKEEQGSYNRTKDESGKDGYSSHHSNKVKMLVEQKIANKIK